MYVPVNSNFAQFSKGFCVQTYLFQRVALCNFWLHRVLLCFEKKKMGRHPGDGGGFSESFREEILLRYVYVERSGLYYYYLKKTCKDVSDGEVC